MVKASAPPQTLATCNICLLEDVLQDDKNLLSNRLISPCACSGTLKSVHRHCLARWRFENEGSDAIYLVALDQNTTQQLQQSRDDNKDFEVQIERLFAANEDLTKLNNTLREENKRLKAQIAALEDRISALEQAFDNQISLREVARVFESACVLHLFIIICLSVHIIGATVVLITYPEWAAGPDRLKNIYGMFFIFGLVQHPTVCLELKYSIQYDRDGTWKG